MLGPEFPSSTSDPLRAQKPRRGGFGVLGLGILAFLVVTSLGALAIFRSTDSPVDAPGCQGSGCDGAAEAASLPSTQSPEPTPCPYCNQDAGFWQMQTGVAPPEITGRTLAVVEGSCGRLLYGRGEHDRLPPASLVKMITALVVMDRARLQDRVDIKINGWDLSAEDWSTIMGLEAGMNLSVEELLYGLLLPSGNDAALTLAEHLGGHDAFVTAMNRRVHALGLLDTRLTNPDGRHDDGQYSSAYDLALIGRELMKNDTLRRIAGTPNFRPNWPSPQTLWNGNEMLYYYPNSIGVKIGWTEQAKFTIVAAAIRDGRELYVSIMDTLNQYLESKRLLDWAFANTRPAC